MSRVSRWCPLGGGHLLAPSKPPLHRVEAHEISVPVMLVIGREICMSALREWAATSGSAAHSAVKASAWSTCVEAAAGYMPLAA